MSIKERQDILVQKFWTNYPGGPQRFCTVFFSCIEKYIGFAGIFNPPPDASEELQAKMRIIRIFLKNTTMFAFEGAITLRIRAELRPQDFPRQTTKQVENDAFKNWTAYRANPYLRELVIPAVGDIPVRCRTRSSARSSKAT